MGNRRSPQKRFWDSRNEVFKISFGTTDRDSNEEVKDSKLGTSFRITES